MDSQLGTNMLANRRPSDGNSLVDTLNDHLNHLNNVDLAKKLDQQAIESNDSATQNRRSSSNTSGKWNILALKKFKFVTSWINWVDMSVGINLLILLKQVGLISISDRKSHQPDFYADHYNDHFRWSKESSTGISTKLAPLS